jgi:hypothetical protein
VIRQAEARWLAIARASADAARSGGMANGVVIGQPRLVGSFPQTVVAVTVETRKWPAWTMEVPVWDVERSRMRSTPIEAQVQSRREFDWHIELIELYSEAMNGYPGTTRFVPPDPQTATELRRLEHQALQDTKRQLEQARHQAQQGWAFGPAELHGSFPHTRLFSRITVLDGEGESKFVRRIWDAEACRTRGVPVRSNNQFDAAALLDLAGRTETTQRQWFEEAAHRRAALDRRAEAVLMDGGAEDIRTAVVLAEPEPGVAYRVTLQAGGDDPLLDSSSARYDVVDAPTAPEALAMAVAWVGGDYRVRASELPPGVLDWHAWRLLGSPPS